MKFFDLFAGVGGFRFGMEAVGHECIGFCEIDKFARESYKAIHNTEGEIEVHDATGVTKKKSKQSDKLMLSAQDFLASLSALLEQEEASKIQMELSFLKSQGLLPCSNLSIYSSRTSRGLLAMIKGIPLRQSSDRWMNWGMMSNGKCLTAKILEYHKTEKGATLSDILEDNVPEMFFLSVDRDQINQLSS